MNVWIALLRGINVGGHNKLPMKQLVAVMEELGCSDVRTYIQSGNVVFRSAGSSAEKLAERIGSAIEASHGFAPRVLVLSLEKFRAAAANSPFPRTEAQSKTVHLGFLSATPDAPDLEAMNAVKGGGEEFALAGDVLYLHTPKGFAKSRLAERVERLVGVPLTARNWRSVTKILELAEQAPYSR